MELSDVVRRIFLRHRLLILLCAIIGAGSFFAYSSSRTVGYTASTRFVLAAPQPDNVDAALAIGDSAEAIGTSPGVVGEAIAEIGASRDPVIYADQNVAVRTLGTSGIIELRVTDVDPKVAADAANALAQRVIEEWSATTGGQVTAAITRVTQQVQDLDERITALEEDITALGVQIARTVDPQVKAALGAEREALIRERDSLNSERVLYQTQLGQLAVQQATATRPEVIDAAREPAQRDSTDVAPSTALGALLGIVIGLGIAAVAEAVRPTLVGSDAIADALQVPVLGELSAREDYGHVERLSLQIQLAAAAAGARIVELVPIGALDASVLAQAIRNSTGDEDASIQVFGANGTAEIARNGYGPVGLVVVSPVIVKRSDLREARDLQNVTSWPLLGVIAYRRSWLRTSAETAPTETRQLV